MTLLNFQTNDTSRMSSGLGPAFLDPYTTPDSGGVTPSTEVGFYSEFSIKFMDEQIELKNGTPLLLEKLMVGAQADTVTLTFDEDNWLTFLGAVAGACILDVPAANAPIGMYRGGQVDTNEYMLMLRQDLREGIHMEFRFWKVGGDGNLPLSYKKDSKLDTYSITFKCLYSARTWCNASTDENMYSEAVEVDSYVSL